MGRGFLSGLGWGSMLSLVLVWVASQMGMMIEVMQAPQDVAVDAPGQVSVEPLEEEVAEAPAETEPPVTAATNGAAVLGGDTADASPPADTTPAVAPQTAEVPAAPEGPVTGEAPALSPAPDAPAPGGVASRTPEPSAADAAPRIAEAAPLPDFNKPVVVVPEPPTQPSVAEDESPSLDAAPDAAPETEQAALPPARPETEGLPEAGVAPDARPEPEAAAEAEPGMVAEAEPETEPGVVAEADDETEDESAERVGTLARTGEMGDLAPTIRVNRLPTIGGPTTDTQPEPEDRAEAGMMAGPAIARFAVPFDNPADRPVMSILLIDDGGAETTAALPFPVSYVVDASRPGATEAMAAYRDAGSEVVAMMPLPAGAGPRDVEVSFETYLDRVPEVVAVMDTPEAGFQSGRQVATQVAQILAAEGLGMITYSKGLNAATQVASREGVPASLVFREFDDAGQDGAAIQRFLDQAAFRAGQQSGVILVGHNRPETVAALLEWGLGNRAATVALAPISTTLLAQ